MLNKIKILTLLPVSQDFTPLGIFIEGTYKMYLVPLIPDLELSRMKLRIHQIDCILN
jgi:hypothetical protein